jgi:hypothetical protein
MVVHQLHHLLLEIPVDRRHVDRCASCKSWADRGRGIRRSSKMGSPMVVFSAALIGAGRL